VHADTELRVLSVTEFRILSARNSLYSDCPLKNSFHLQFSVRLLFIAMASECCIRGFQWNGAPTGREERLADNNAYVSGSNPTVAIMVISDLLGWTFINERLLCDQYAKEAEAIVYMPDYFGGEVVPSDILRDFSRWGEFDLKAWSERNSPEVRGPEILAYVNPALSLISARHISATFEIRAFFCCEVELMS
jgi:hypothetical protein